MLAAKTTNLPELTAAEQALWLELIRQRCGLTFSDAAVDDRQSRFAGSLTHAASGRS